MKKIIISLCLLYHLNSALAFNCDGNIDVPIFECEALNDVYNSLNIANSTLPDAVKAAWGDKAEINICGTNDGNGLGILCDEATTVVFV